jgi:hypothetical protein
VIDLPSGENEIDLGTCHPGSGHRLMRSNEMGLASRPAISTFDDELASTVGEDGEAVG